MPLENILQALEAEAERQVAESEAAAQAEIEKIQTEAEAEAGRARQAQITAIEAPLKAEQARILNKAKLEASQIVLGSREELMSSAISAAAEQLAELADSQNNGDLLCHLTREAVEALDAAGPFCFRVREADVARMKQVIQALELSGDVEADLIGTESYWNSGLGGVIVSTPDERLKIVNTLEIRLQRATELYRARLAGWLFEELFEDTLENTLEDAEEA